MARRNGHRPTLPRKEIRIGGILYVEHAKSAHRRALEHMNGEKQSEPIYACPGRFELTAGEIMTRLNAVKT